jgi:hypothetical protein
MIKAMFGTVALATLVLTTGAALACPYATSAQTSDQQQTTASSDLPLPTDGAKTETKTGG